MISKLDAITFWGIKKILDHRLDEDMGELAFRILSVIRSLKGGRLSEGGIKRNLMELGRMKDVIDDILAIRGIGIGSGVLPFEEALKEIKRQRLSETAPISKKHRKQANSKKQGIKKDPKKPVRRRKKKSKARTRGR